MKCDFGRLTLTPCPNDATHHFTPESYIAKVFGDRWSAPASMRKITQADVDPLGHTCDEHKRDGMVPIAK